MAIAENFKKFGAGVRDYSASFGLGAVPAFLGTAIVACIYSVSYGAASAVGMSGGVAVAAGVVGSVVLGSVGLGVGILLGAGSILAIANMPGLENAKLKKGAAIAGAAVGVGASIGLAYALTSGSAEAPKQNAPAAVTQPLKQSFAQPVKAPVMQQAALVDLRSAPKLAI